MGLNKRLLYNANGARKSGVALQFDGDEVMRMLDRMLFDNVVKKKDVRKIIRQEIAPARKDVIAAAKGAMKSDPRNAKIGVKTMVYKNATGANVSLFNRKGSAKSVKEYNPPRGGRSGIKRNRSVSKDTARINSYRGRDRAFILRFINDGTEGRHAFKKSRSKNNRTAYRGAIAARNFFGVAEESMRRASGRISDRVVRLITEVSEGK